MTIDYHATFPDWAVAAFLVIFAILVIGLVASMWYEARHR